MPKLLLPALAAIAVLIGVLYLSQQRTEPFKVSGFIEADEIRVGSRVGGRVDRVQAEEGQTVKRGALLVELAPYDLRERRDQAAAELAARRADLKRLEEGFRKEDIAQAEARLKQLEARRDKLVAGNRPQDIDAGKSRLQLAQAQLERAKQDYQRVKPLFEKGVRTRDDFDRATEELSVNEAQTAVRQAELNLLIEGTREEEKREAAEAVAEATAALALAKAGYRQEERDAAKSAVDAASAALAVIERQIEELRVAAPVDGVIEAVELQPGDLVGANAPVLSILDTSRLWVRAYVPENRMIVRPEQQVFVTVDSFPGRRFKGHVSFISRQAEFTPGNVQTPEERSKQVFRIKVQLDEGRQELRAGMAADVWLESPDGDRGGDSRTPAAPARP
jgi:multidrug resistance efflux pump